MNNSTFHNYVYMIYHHEPEINNTTESDKSASYLDILLNIDSNDKLDGFNCLIFNILFPCSNIQFSLAYGVHISQLIQCASLIRCAKAYLAYEDFLKRGKLLTNKLILQGCIESRL
jgi:hypothetical protein